MKKYCEFCEKQYTAQGQISKFCSTNCRVKWNMREKNSDNYVPKQKEEKSIVPPEELLEKQQWLEMLQLAKSDAAN